MMFKHINITDGYWSYCKAPYHAYTLKLYKVAQLLYFRIYYWWSRMIADQVKKWNWMTLLIIPESLWHSKFHVHIYCNYHRQCRCAMTSIYDIWKLGFKGEGESVPKGTIKSCGIFTVPNWLFKYTLSHILDS